MNKQRIRQTLFCLFLSGWVLFSTLPVSAATSCTDLVTNNCLSCHLETRICQKITQQKSKRQWKRTVKNMIRYGAEISDADASHLFTCLSSKGMPINEICTPK